MKSLWSGQLIGMVSGGVTPARSQAGRTVVVM
jgi:hypothetical protein